MVVEPAGRPSATSVKDPRRGSPVSWSQSPGSRRRRGMDVPQDSRSVVSLFLSVAAVDILLTSFIVGSKESKNSFWFLLLL